MENITEEKHNKNKKFKIGIKVICVILAIVIYLTPAFMFFFIKLDEQQTARQNQEIVRLRDTYFHCFEAEVYYKIEKGEYYLSVQEKCNGFRIHYLESSVHNEFTMSEEKHEDYCVFYATLYCLLPGGYDFYVYRILELTIELGELTRVASKNLVKKY